MNEFLTQQDSVPDSFHLRCDIHDDDDDITIKDAVGR